MANREGFVVSRNLPAASPIAPKEVVPSITVEVRVAWPACMGHEQAVVDVLEEALLEARFRVAELTLPATEVQRAADKAADDAAYQAGMRAWRERRTAEAAVEAELNEHFDTRDAQPARDLVSA